MPRSPSTEVDDVPASTKARILSAAELVFSERGFDGASTREIASRAGVNISSLHYHWASKETLYLAVFHDIFERLVNHLQTSIGALAHERDRKVVVQGVMQELFDFFDRHPAIPRLMMRRIVDADTVEGGVERDVLVPAWEVFSQWLGRTGAVFSDRDAQLFMLSIHSVLVVYLLDSPVYQTLLGGSVHTPEVREPVREHVIAVVHALIDSAIKAA